MRMLLGALALAASLLHTVTRAGQVETLYTSPAHRAIAAFAQDGDLVAWFAPSGGEKGCNEVWVWQIGSAQQHLPAEGPTSHNVTCDWQVPAGSPIDLAVAGNGGSPALLWTLHEAASKALRFDYVVGATVADPTERRFQEVGHANRGAGLWLGGVAGNGTTLVYAVTDVEYKDQVACLSTPSAPGACALAVVGGGVYRIVGRKTPERVGPSAALAVATSDDLVAYIPAAGASSIDGHPLASADKPVDVRQVSTGKQLASIMPEGIPVAIGLSGTTLALIGRSAGRLTLTWYDISTGQPVGSLELPTGAATQVCVGVRDIVYRVGRSIRAVDVATKRVHVVAKAASTPVGLSVAGNRIAWAENVHGRGRIRAITLTS
jgi:hypothetical protein